MEERQTANGGQMGLVEILLVEDDLNDVKLITHALQKYHLANRIYVVRDGAEALDYLFGTGTYEGRDTSNEPKVILLDLKLPFVDGLGVLQQIKAHELTREIPVVVLTSSRESPDVQECYRLGVNSYIVKPLDFEQFSSAVTQVGLYWALLNEPPQVSTP